MSRKYFIEVCGLSFHFYSSFFSQFQVYSKVIQLYIYVYIYLFLFQILCPYRLSSTVLYSKSLLVIDFIYVCVYAQSCQTLFDPMDCSLPGSSVHGIYQTRILEQVAIFFSRGNLPDSGIKPTSLVFPALAGRFFTTAAPGKPILYTVVCIC